MDIFKHFVQHYDRIFGKIFIPGSTGTSSMVLMNIQGTLWRQDNYRDSNLFLSGFDTTYCVPEISTITGQWMLATRLSIGLNMWANSEAWHTDQMHSILTSYSITYLTSLYILSQSWFVSFSLFTKVACFAVDVFDVKIRELILGQPLDKSTFS